MKRLLALATFFLFASVAAAQAAVPSRLLESAQAWAFRGCTNVLRGSDAKRRCIFPRRRFLGPGILGAGE